MADSLGSRLKRAWNVFLNRDPTPYYTASYGGYSFRPDRPRLSRGSERSIVTSVFNKIAMDAASIDIRHVRLDDEERYLETIDSPLNECFSVEANIDQTGRAFVQDAVMSMLDEGCVALLPIETDRNPKDGSFNVYDMRTAKVVAWMPQHVRVQAYNEKTGNREEVVVPKRNVAIIENPLYSVMNEPNSTMQRLIRKLVLLDAVDEQNGSGKLDLIIQLPYIIKTEARRQQAENRRKDIEQQLAGSKYGIAYTDGTERITQLNRPIENNLFAQIEYLTNLLYSQLGITQGVLDGSADEKTMLNYYSRTIEPILAAITDEVKRKFLSKTARTQGQSIEFFRDTFKLVPISQIADIADPLSRNTIVTPNEMRQKLGMKPSNDPAADELGNRNMPAPEGEAGIQNGGDSSDYDTILEDVLNSLEGEVDNIIAGVGGEEGASEEEEE